MNTKQEQMNKEKLQEEINKEMGYVSALFMSQGDTRAGDIVMPSTEILESVDRIMLYISSYIQSEIDRAVAEERNRIVEMIATDASEEYGIDEKSKILSLITKEN